jgi:ADP-ribose pyrophosphatase YjhB (NUDIX family)
MAGKGAGDDISRAIRLLESRAGDARTGLPEDLFLFVTRLTPMVCVDLLIKDAVGRTLLTWREDAYSPPGWHVPGGIIRYKEPAAQRIAAVARTELGAEVNFEPQPLAVSEIIHPQRETRGHFVALLYRCFLRGPLDEGLRFSGQGTPRPNQWAWHERCPSDLLDVHSIYGDFIGAR